MLNSTLLLNFNSLAKMQIKFKLCWAYRRSRRNGVSYVILTISGSGSLVGRAPELRHHTDGVHNWCGV